MMRKISADAVDKNISLQEAASSINDALRYTTIFSPGEYAAGVETIIADLESRGYRVIKIKNYWDKGDSYNGINSIVESPSGQRFELQFHTPETWDVKQNRTHPLYEKQRSSRDAKERKRLEVEMVEIADSVTFPKGVSRIGKPP